MSFCYKIGPVTNNLQLQLPKFKGVKKIKKSRKLPQPRVDRDRSIKKFELLHRPFDLRFRGLIHRWLNYVQMRNKFVFKDILDKVQLEVVNLYFYPQTSENKWLNQEEIVERTKITSIKKLKSTLVAALLRIWARNKKVE